MQGISSAASDVYKIKRRYAVGGARHHFPKLFLAVTDCGDDFGELWRRYQFFGVISLCVDVIGGVQRDGCRSRFGTDDVYVLLRD